MLNRTEFQAVYDQGPEAVFALVARLEAEIEALRAEVAALKAQVGKDSHNSSKPPSSDPPARPGRAPRSLREPTDRPSGGQPGHPGRTLSQVDQPDETVRHAPLACTGCGSALDPRSLTDTGQRRQVFELPPVQVQVTEHRQLAGVCPCCGTRNVGEFPAGVEQPVQYGPRLLATCAYLTGYHLLPLARAAELLRDLFGQAPSQGTLVRAQQRCDQALAGVEEAVKAALTAAPVAHFDETYVQVAKRQAWLHVVSTKALTYLSYQAKRGREAFAAVGVLPRFGGVAVHDAWVSYLDPDYPARHALCNAHLLRELVELWETTQQTWTQRMMALLRSLLRAKKAAQAAGWEALEPALLERYLNDYRRLVERGLKQNPPLPRTGRRGRPKRGPARCLLERLLDHEDDVLRFAMEFAVPFDNNQAERDQRMAKVQQKVSGCFRTEAGAERFSRLRGYLSTLRKQGLELLPALTEAMAGRVHYPDLSVG